MKYLVCEKQNGEGCDYTIGCGMNYYIIEGRSIEDVEGKVIFPPDNIGDTLTSDSQYDSHCLREILIVPMEHVFSVDVKSINEALLYTKIDMVDLKVEQQEKDELIRLQEKYG